MSLKLFNNYFYFISLIVALIRLLLVTWRAISSKLKLYIIIRFVFTLLINRLISLSFDVYLPFIFLLLRVIGLQMFNFIYNFKFIFENKIKINMFLYILLAFQCTSCLTHTCLDTDRLCFEYMYFQHFLYKISFWVTNEFVILNMGP